MLHALWVRNATSGMMHCMDGHTYLLVAMHEGDDADTSNHALHCFVNHRQWASTLATFVVVCLLVGSGGALQQPFVVLCAALL